MMDLQACMQLDLYNILICMRDRIMILLAQPLAPQASKCISTLSILQALYKLFERTKTQVIAVMHKPRQHVSRTVSHTVGTGAWSTHVQGETHSNILVKALGL
jgi:hypothetical protein